MKFWLSASLVVAASSAAVAADTQISSPRAGQSPVRHGNETMLAGLRPGRDTFAAAEKRFKGKTITEEPNSGSREWRDDCSGRSIRLEVDAKSVIQSVTITTLGTQEGKCSDRRPDFLDPRNWLTGLGLRMGDSQDRVVGLYGEPNSSGPASKNGQDLELMYYQFDWAGSDVPQVMEVLCARDSGRVVEITLAFPSL
jgi:opacity protein-like surface antigen